MSDRRGWSPDETRVVRWAWFNGVRRKVVCRELGRSYEALRSYQRRIGLCGGDDPKSRKDTLAEGS